MPPGTKPRPAIGSSKQKKSSTPQASPRSPSPKAARSSTPRSATPRSGSPKQSRPPKPTAEAVPSETKAKEDAPPEEEEAKDAKTGKAATAAEASGEASKPAAPSTPEAKARRAKSEEGSKGKIKAGGAAAASSKPAGAASTSFKAGGSKAGGKNKDANVKKENKHDMYTSEYLLQMAAEQEAKAAEQEALAMSAGSLPSQLGALLQKKMEEGMKTKELAKEFFQKMDKNGDGSISRMEFRQTMRELGLVAASSSADAKGAPAGGGGASGAGSSGGGGGGGAAGGAPNIKDVDALFAVLDKDGGGDLDLLEITHGLKDLQAKAKQMELQVAAAREKADFWKEMGEATRNASSVVAAWEAAVRELRDARVPSVEMRIGALLMRKNLKPTDIVAQWDTDGGGTIGYACGGDEFESAVLGTRTRGLAELFPRGCMAYCPYCHSVCLHCGAWHLRRVLIFTTWSWHWH